MSGAGPRLAAITDAVARLREDVRNALERRRDARARAICPADALAFTPLYTRGRCPLCGWAPPGYEYRPPLMHRYDWYWGALAGMAAMSVVVGIVIVTIYRSS